MRKLSFLLLCIWLLACCAACRQPSRSAIHPIEQTANTSLGSARRLAGTCQIYCVFAGSEAQPWTLADAAQAADLLTRAAQYLQAQLDGKDLPLQLKYPSGYDPKYVCTARYAGDFAANGEDGMLVGAAAEEWLQRFDAPPTDRQAVYLILINGQGESYPLPQLRVTETQLAAEKAVLYVQDAAPRELAAAVAALFTRETVLFDGQVFAGQDFSPAFWAYICGGE